MANSNVVSISMKLDPLKELDGKKLKLLMAKDVGFKKPGAITIKADFVPTTPKWTKSKNIEDAIANICRYDLSLYATQLMENYMPFEKATNGQDKMKALKEFNKKVPNLYKSLNDRIGDKVTDLQEEISSDVKFNEKALAGAYKALEKNPATDMKDAVVKVSNEMRELIRELLKEQAIAKKKGGEDEEKFKTTLKSGAATFKGLASDYQGKGLGGVQESTTVLKSFSGALKAGVAETEAKEAKTTITALKNALRKLGDDTKASIKPIAEISANLSRGLLDAKMEGQIGGIVASILKSASELEDRFNKAQATYKKKAKDAKA